MQTNEEVLRDQFEATNERDFERAMSHYADDVEVVVHPDAFLDAGTFKGREAVRRYFGDWFATFKRDYRFELEELRTIGDSILLIATHHGRGRASGVEVRTTTGYIYTFRDGKVSREEIFPGPDEAREAAAALEDPA